MVSLRCKMIVKEELVNLGLHPARVDLGVAEVRENISEEVREQLRANLSKVGLELLEDRTSILIEQVKGIVIEMVHYLDDSPKVNYSDYISERLNYDYTYLSNLFSKVKGITIQQFIITHKIERVKELGYRLKFRDPANGSLAVPGLIECPDREFVEQSTGDEWGCRCHHLRAVGERR